MKIKNLALSLCLATVLPLTAFANFDAEDKAEHLSKMLNLDSNRASQVEQIYKNYEDQHKVLKDQKEEQLKTVLTDEEMERLKEMKKDKHHKKHKEWKKD